MCEMSISDNAGSTNECMHVIKYSQFIQTIRVYNNFTKYVRLFPVLNISGRQHLIYILHLPTYCDGPSLNLLYENRPSIAWHRYERGKSRAVICCVYRPNPAQLICNCMLPPWHRPVLNPPNLNFPGSIQFLLPYSTPMSNTLPPGLGVCDDVMRYLLHSQKIGWDVATALWQRITCFTHNRRLTPLAKHTLTIFTLIIRAHSCAWMCIIFYPTHMDHNLNLYCRTWCVQFKVVPI
jgi:hypothetical protein